MRIFTRVTWRTDVKRVGSWSTAIFSVFAGYFFVNFQDDASIIISHTQSVIGFSVIPKYMTLNDPEA